MKKLKLDLEKLEVDSFDTAEKSAKQQGTVRGHDDETFSCNFTANCATDDCSNLNCGFTDWYSCYGGCSDSGCGPGQKCYTE